jgi:16S rRNA processing protein RimM
MEETEMELFCLGVVIGTHGLRGDLKVKSLSDGSESLLAAQRVYLRAPGKQAVEYRPARVVAHKGGYLLRLAGFEQIDSAQVLVGCEVLMPLSELPELDDSEHYWFELEGLQVIDRTRGVLGKLEDLFTTPAHDIYVVRGPFGEVLIPAVDAFVGRIDLDAGTMEVDLPDGLIPGTDEI